MKEEDPSLDIIAERLEGVKHKILVLSGKGGVGKSTITAQLAWTLQSMNRQVGVIDVDICGPSIPRMFGVENEEVKRSNMGWQPVYVRENLAVISVGFMLSDRTSAVVWRGPRKDSLIKQFFTDVSWGDLDYLLVDAPPGTSDEHISTVKALEKCAPDGALIVTTPQEVALLDVRKEISFCRKVGLPILGVVENMSGFTTAPPATTLGMEEMMTKVEALSARIPSSHEESHQLLADIAQYISEVSCPTTHDVFPPTTGGAAEMCREMGVPFLGSIPLDPNLARAAEAGQFLMAISKETASSGAIQSMVSKLMQCTPALAATAAQELDESSDESDEQM